MKVKVTPQQLAWLTTVARRRVEAATRLNKEHKDIKRYTSILKAVEKVEGDCLSVGRPALRSIEEMCLHHINFIQTILLPEMAKRPVQGDGKAVKTSTYLLQALQHLLKEVQGAL